MLKMKFSCRQNVQKYCQNLTSLCEGCSSDSPDTGVILQDVTKFQLKALFYLILVWVCDIDMKILLCTKLAEIFSEPVHIFCVLVSPQEQSYKVKLKSGQVTGFPCVVRTVYSSQSVHHSYTCVFRTVYSSQSVSHIYSCVIRTVYSSLQLATYTPVQSESTHWSH